MKQFRNMAYPYIAWSIIMIILPMLLIVHSPRRAMMC